MKGSNVTQSSRIPAALQQVFLASNRGEEVTQAPDGNVAAKDYLSKWKFKGKKPKFVMPKVTISLRRGKKTVSKYQKYDDYDNESVFSLTEEMEFSSSNDESQEIEKKKRDQKIEKKKRDQKIEKKKRDQVLPVKDVAPVKKHSHIDMHPRDYLLKMLRSRGYSTATTKSLESGYRSRPTRLQQASYHAHLINLARQGKNSRLKRIMNCGISPNPCNKHGESLVHTVCRRCGPKTLQVLLDAGTKIEVCDDYGRTPLHDACWRPQPCFKIVDMIARRDLNLFHVTDSRGDVPLKYVRKEHWSEWNAFLESKLDSWWPSSLDTSDDKSRASIMNASFLKHLPPNSRTIPDPKNALSPEFAAMVTAGRISPEEVIEVYKKDRMMKEAMKRRKSRQDEPESDSDDSDSESDSESESESESDSDSSYDSSDDDSVSSDDSSVDNTFMLPEDLADILGRVKAAKASKPRSVSLETRLSNLELIEHL